jgi:hypothetical protein
MCWMHERLSVIEPEGLAFGVNPGAAHQSFAFGGAA